MAPLTAEATPSTTSTIPATMGRLGIWTFALDVQPMNRAQEVVAELDELGFGAVWIPEAVGREPFASAALLLSATQRLVVATGIASRPMAEWRELATVISSL